MSPFEQEQEQELELEAAVRLLHHGFLVYIFCSGCWTWEGIQDSYWPVK